MMWLVYATEAEAQARADEIAQMLPCGANDVTRVWAIPQQITDRRWVIPSPDETGVEAGQDWWPKQEMQP